ncbi:MAG: 30S ribosomal protein S8 [Acidimicrobiia bacterium]
MTDPIADMLTRIRNAVAVGHERVTLPASKTKEALARVLASEGFIDRYEIKSGDKGSELMLVLRYGERRSPVIRGLRRVSKPGHRIYSGAAEIPRVQGGLGIAIVSTSQGLMADREARRRRLGGEIMAEVW